MAKGETFGIGGWLITSSRCAWFSEQYCVSEARTVWPQLQDTAQRYIACSAKQWSFKLSSASDNAPTEAGLDAARRGIQFIVTHIAGEKNVWADALSRNRVQAFQNRMHERPLCLGKH